MHKKSSKNILLTRAKENNLSFKCSLIQKGFNVFECDLVKYDIVNFNYDILKSYSHIILTGNYATNIMPRNIWSAEIFVVGHKSASILKAKGYKIAAIYENASELRKYITARRPEKILYLCSNNITIKMPEFVNNYQLYKVEYRKFLTTSHIEIIKRGIDYIPLYSENCAKTLLNLLRQNNLLNYLENATLVVISSKVAQIYKNITTKIIVSDKPEHMIEYIK